MRRLAREASATAELLPITDRNKQALKLLRPILTDLARTRGCDCGG